MLFVTHAAALTGAEETEPREIPRDLSTALSTAGDE